MSKKAHVQLWHKKQGRETGINALAARSSTRGAKPVGPQARLTPAQSFLKNLMAEVRKAV